MDIDVIGNGNIGAKARELLEKTPALKQIGFYVPRRTVLAEDYFDEFFQRSRLGNNLQSVEAVEGLENKVRNGKLSRREFEILSSVCSSYGSSPLAIRSSAEGDSRGTGTYKTEFSDNYIGRVRKSLQKVLASYFSQDAIAFRRDANVGEGFGVIIEPIIGQDFGWRGFAPVLSGFGYTSTSRGGSYVNVVVGLGGGVESRNGEKISREVIRQFDGSLDQYIEAERDSIRFGEQSKRSSALLQTDRGPSFGTDSYSATAFEKGNKYHGGNACATTLSFNDDLRMAFESLNLNPFFGMIAKMEQALGKPQYFEWAMTLEDTTPKYWITQVADINKRLDVMDFSDLGDIIFEAHTVTGTGTKECYKIANCYNPSDCDPLRKFNTNNRDYVLLFSSRLTLSFNNVRRLGYSDFSNASVFLEIQDAQHTGDPVAHLGGQLDATKKFFGVVDYREENRPNWERFESRNKVEHGIEVYQGRVKAVASERQNRMVISALD